LTAAFEELAENGFNGATVAGVAKRSGVHETTVYRRWITRENLFVAALLDRSADAISAPDTGTTRGDLLAIVRGVIAYVSSPDGCGGAARGDATGRRHVRAGAPGLLGASS
jgi:AcrR family transcriptional regulator